jgi:hypothetical protein
MRISVHSFAFFRLVGTVFRRSPVPIQELFLENKTSSDDLAKAGGLPLLLRHRTDGEVFHEGHSKRERNVQDDHKSATFEYLSPLPPKIFLCPSTF